MIYYDKYDKNYIKALNSGEITYCTKVLVLNWQEQVLTDITDKCDLEGSTVTMSTNQRGIRRQGTLKLINDDGSLDVNENKYLWALRKFRIFQRALYTAATHTYFRKEYSCLRMSAGARKNR